MHDFLIAALGGLAATALLWSLTRIFAPKARWSAGVLRKPSDTTASGYRYQVKFSNASLVRSMLDIRMHAQLVLQDLKGTDKWFRVPLDMTFAYVPHLYSGNSRLISLGLEQLDEDVLARLRDIDPTMDVIFRQDRRLEAILESTESYLVVSAIATDGWSGRVRYLSSPFYRDGAVQPLGFKRDVSLAERVLKRTRRRIRNQLSQHRRTIPFDPTRPTEG